MKKLLLVIMVVAMASFLFVGCMPSPTPDPDPDPDPTPTAITATIAVATETPADALGKVYVKDGPRDITVTFSEAVENPVVKVGTVVVPMFSVDNLVFVGTGDFVGPCDAVLITVGGVCADLCAAKSVVVDSGNPFAELQATVAECDCSSGYTLTITSDWTASAECAPDDEGCCGDACSGLEKWNIKVYDDNPFEGCCEDADCLDPIKVADSTVCPIAVTTDCIDEVWTTDSEWVGFFDQTYYVIATLTDNVGNVMEYFGKVIATSATDVKFVELHHQPTDPDVCLCDAEDPDLANDIIGDCDGTPTTECWEPEVILDPCPVVELDPAAPVVGQLVTITVNYTDAVKPECPALYVGPAIKGFPLGIPDDAQEVLITDGDEDDIWEGTYIFGQAGKDIIYVTDACGDCSPCKTEVTVAERVCPEISVDGEKLFLDDMWVAEGDLEVTITFASPVPIEKVRAFRVGDLEDAWDNPILPEDAEELILSTEDDLVYTAIAKFSAHSGHCDEDYVIVQYGESCCPVICTEMFMVDDSDPYAALEADTAECVIGCDTGIEIVISVLENTPACDPEEFCCGDDCTEIVQWDLTIFNTNPFDTTCCVLDYDACDIFFEDSGVNCDDLGSVTPCIPAEDYEDGDYPVIFHLTDLVGNETTYYGVLTIGANGTSAVLQNATSIDPDATSPACIEWTGSGAFMGSCSTPSCP